MLTNHDVLTKIHGVSATLSRLEGQLQSLQQREASLVEQVAQAKGRLAAKDEVTEILDLMQRKAHERNVGVYQRLLTHLLQDVFPNNTSEIKLDLGTERGAPSLDIEIERDNNREDVLEGNGGALTNVVSTGLRYMALARMRKNRAFMLLDEPDCWISGDNVPQFANVLHRLAVDSRIQTLLITHHGLSLMPAEAGVLQLEVRGDVPSVTVDGAPPVWTPELPGIRYIRMIDVRRHHDTTLPLYPGVTVLTGPNNTGKSVVESALAAMAYGDSNDKLIRHGADSCKIIVGIEDGKRLELVRVRKGTPKVMCALYQDGTDTPLREEPLARGMVPDWVTANLGIAKVDELDIQLGHQKSPVFLLNERSPSKRATILSIGSESSHLRNLMDDYSAMAKADRDTSLRGERELNEAKATIQRFSVLADLRSRVTAGERDWAAISGLLESDRAHATLVSTLVEGAAKLHSHAARKDVLARCPAIPELTDTTELAKTITTLSSLKRKAALKRSTRVVQEPVLEAVDALSRLIKELSDNSRVAKLQARLAALPVPLVPELTDVAPLQVLLDSHRIAMRSLREKQTALDLSQMELGELTETWGACPTCHNLVFGVTHAH